MRRDEPQPGTGHGIRTRPFMTDPSSAQRMPKMANSSRANPWDRVLAARGCAAALIADTEEKGSIIVTNYNYISCIILSDEKMGVMGGAAKMAGCKIMW